MCKNKLGFISQKYESGKLGCGAASSGKDDPGGVSYGTYQLASNTGTLQKFLKASKYYLKFAGMAPGSTAFNAKWKELANDIAFCDAQHNFIKATHFDPVVKLYAVALELARSCAIDEALWSMSVQHSYAGVVKIIDAAEAAIPDNYTDIDMIHALYKARSNYISGLNLKDNIKASLLKRYKAEMAEIIKIQD